MHVGSREQDEKALPYDLIDESGQAGQKEQQAGDYQACAGCALGHVRNEKTPSLAHGFRAACRMIASGAALMNHFVLLYDVVDDMVTRRAPYRAEHLQLIREGHERGEIVMAGA